MQDNNSFLLQGLNEQQRAAVSAARQNMLVVAGAGTGKTRVLVSRVAWLLSVEQLPARSLMAVTFTNKAADEMKERIGALNYASVDLRGLWCGTFHSLCARFLRSYAPQAGLQPNFVVIDSADQTALINEILKSNEQWGQDAKDYKIKPAALGGQISKFKEQCLRAADVSALKKGFSNEVERLAAEIYPEYEKRCNAMNGVDFSELLLRTYELFEQNQPLRELQHKRFEEILVDEFQDTNELQYKLLKLLAGPNCHVFAVGDDDQSIYGWRGAVVDNLWSFKKDFEPVAVYKLERNYRSTSQIVAAANALIKSNKDRLTDKVLVSDKGTGPMIEAMSFRDGPSEAEGIAKEIRRLIDEQQVSADSIAILYRVNARAANIETALMTYNIPYYVYGGLKFFERMEIQDALGYLKLSVNEADDTCFSRVINQPPRGIGPAKITTLRKIASERGCSLMQALRLACDYVKEHGKEAAKEIKAVAKSAVPFIELIDGLHVKAQEGAGPAALLEELLVTSQLRTFYKELDEKEKDKSFKEGKREQNLDELIANAKAVEKRCEDEPILDAEGKPISALITFLSNAALLSSAEINENGDNSTPTDQKVRLFTVHSAKGLEFDTVFISGFEKEVMPWGFASGPDNDKREAEERRLAYVAVTRAKRLLYLCWGRYTFHYMYGTMRTGPSPYVKEMQLGLGKEHGKIIHQTAFGSDEDYQEEEHSWGYGGYGSYGRRSSRSEYNGWSSRRRRY